MNVTNQGFLRQARLVMADALGHFNADDGWAMASNVALTALMALFPFLIFVAAFAGTFGDSGLANRVANLVFASWPEAVANPIAGEVHRVLTPIHGNLLTYSALVALILASSGVEAVRTALNRAYRVVDRRSFLWLRLQSVIFVLIGTVVLLLVAIVGVVFAAVPLPTPFDRLFGTIGAITAGILIVAMLVVAHIWLPAGRPPWRQLWPGILATLALWLLSAWIFAVYLRSFSNYAATYAGLAGVVIAMFFLYVVSAVMIFGAEFNAALGRLREGRLG